MIKKDGDLLDNVDLLAKERNPTLANLPIKDLRKTKAWQTSLDRFSVMRMNALKNKLLKVIEDLTLFLMLWLKFLN